MNDFENAVEAIGLTKQFDSFTAVDGVDFYIPKGEIFGLLGPNGAGKTTIIRMLCGILSPTSGKGSVLGWDICRDAERIKQKIGYMSQKFSLYNDLSCRENILFYAQVYNVNKNDLAKQTSALIEKLSLDDIENTLVGELSGAWRQRVALACAVIHNPPMLFLDEATAGVDPISRREFWDFIYQIAGEGTSVLATTHYMDEAEFCNKVGMMYAGKLVKIASPDSIKNALPGILVAIECDQPMAAEKFLRQQKYVLDVSLHGAQVHIRVGSKKEKAKLVSGLRKIGVHVSNTEFIQPSLEDVFIAMIEQYRKDETMDRPLIGGN